MGEQEQRPDASVRHTCLPFAFRFSSAVLRYWLRPRRFFGQLILHPAFWGYLQAKSYVGVLTYPIY